MAQILLGGGLAGRVEPGDGTPGRGLRRLTSVLEYTSVSGTRMFDVAADEQHVVEPAEADVVGPPSPPISHTPRCTRLAASAARSTRHLRRRPADRPAGAELLDQATLFDDLLLVVLAEDRAH